MLAAALCADGEQDLKQAHQSSDLISIQRLNNDARTFAFREILL